MTLPNDWPSDGSTTENRGEGDALDTAFARARTRGAKAIAELFKSPDMLSEQEFGSLVGASRETIAKWRASGEVLALHSAAHGLRYPNWQITDDGRLLQGLKGLTGAQPSLGDLSLPAPGPSGIARQNGAVMSEGLPDRRCGASSGRDRQGHFLLGVKACLTESALRRKSRRPAPVAKRAPDRFEVSTSQRIQGAPALGGRPGRRILIIQNCYTLSRRGFYSNHLAFPMGNINWSYPNSIPRMNLGCLGG